MKKISFLTLLVCSLALVGCGGNSQESSSSTNSETSTSSTESETTTSSTESETTTSPAEPTIADYVSSMNENANKVNHVTSVANEGYGENTTEAFFGENYTKIAAQFSIQHFVKDGEEITCYNESTYDHSISINSFANKSGYYGVAYENLFGYHMNTEENFSAYGSEDLVNKLYVKGATNPNGDFDSQIANEPNVSASFSYGFYDASNSNFFNVECSFVLAGLNDAMNSANVSIKTYADGSYVLDLETGRATLNDGATPTQSKSYAITQELGARNAEFPFDLSTMYFTSLKFSYKGAAVNSDTVITTSKGSNISLDIAEKLPETAKSAIDAVVVTCTPANGIYANYIDKSEYNPGGLSINPSAEGEYTISYATKNCSGSFKVVCEAAKPETVESVLCYLKNADGSMSTDMNQSMLLTNGYNAYTNFEYYFKGTFTPYAADQDFTMEITSSNASKATFERKEDCKYFVNDTQTFTAYKFVTNAADETFTIKVTSKTVSSVTATFEVRTADMPSFEEILNNKKFFSVDTTNNALDKTFEFTYSDATSQGHVVVVSGNSSSESDFTVNSSTGAFVMADSTVFAGGINLTSMNVYMVKEGPYGSQNIELNVYDAKTVITKCAWNYVFENGDFINVSVGNWSGYSVDVTVCVGGAYSWQSYKATDISVNGNTAKLVGLSCEQDYSTAAYFFDVSAISENIVYTLGNSYAEITLSNGTANTTYNFNFGRYINY